MLVKEILKELNLFTEELNISKGDGSCSSELFGKVNGTVQEFCGLLCTEAFLYFYVTSHDFN